MANTHENTAPRPKLDNSMTIALMGEKLSAGNALVTESDNDDSVCEWRVGTTRENELSRL
jgi:hypothetical protein